VADEPTLGEGVRRLEDRLADVRDDIAQLGRRLDEKVDQRIYDLRHEALSARVTTLEVQREKDVDKLTATRRWMIGVVITVVVALLPYLGALVRGAGA
jgi:hypothetical protein